MDSAGTCGPTTARIPSSVFPNAVSREKERARERILQMEIEEEDKGSFRWSSRLEDPSGQRWLRPMRWRRDGEWGSRQCESTRMPSSSL